MAACLGLGEHSGVDIDERYIEIGAALQASDGDIAAAASKIEKTIRRILREPQCVDHEALPQTMKPERGEIIHDVVMRCDTIKDLIDAMLSGIGAAWIDLRGAIGGGYF